MEPVSIGVTLVIIGVLCLIAEVSSPGFFIAIPGTAAIVLGVITVIYPDFLSSVWSPIVALIVVVVATYGIMQFYSSLAPPDSPPETKGSSSMKGKKAKVIKAIVPDEITGAVSLEGREWSATAEVEIPEGSRVIVLEVEGVHVVVEPVEE